MESGNSEQDNKNRINRRGFWILFGIPGLLLALATVMVLVGLYLFKRHDDGTASLSQFLWLGVPVSTSVVLLLIAGIWRQYASVRYLQMPTWRWMAGGFKGRPKSPVLSSAKESEQTQATAARTPGQFILFWLGGAACLVGVLMQICHLAWRVICKLQGHNAQASLLLGLFWVGFALFLVGVFLVKISMPRSVRKTDVPR